MFGDTKRRQYDFFVGMFIGVLAGIFLVVSLLMIGFIHTSSVLTAGIVHNAFDDPWSSFNSEAFAEDLARGPWECVEGTTTTLINLPVILRTENVECFDDGVEGTTDYCVIETCYLYSNSHINATPEQLKAWEIPEGEVV